MVRSFPRSWIASGAQYVAWPVAVLAALIAGDADCALAQAVAAPGSDDIQTFALARRYATSEPQPPVRSPGSPSYVAPSYLARGVPAVPPLNSDRWQSPVDSLYGGAEYLLIRTHFSEAIAYVQVTDSLSGGLPHESVQAREINFPYSSAFRTYVGYHLTPTAAIQFTYFHLGSSAAANGSPASPNQSFVDAYGDKANFGQSIATNSSVMLNVFDLDYAGRFSLGGGRLNLRPAAGARWADVRQHYDSTVSDPLAGVVGTGTFNTHFTGFGPHFSLLGQAHCTPNSPFSLIARGATSLLVGGYNNTSGAVFTGVAGADQSAHRTLMVPVLEAEIGAAWQPTSNLTFSAGWLWQAWFDLGVSGGTDGGKYIEADDSSIMSFDGLFLRGLWQY